jgi:hypothetical protein
MRADRLAHARVASGTVHRNCADLLHQPEEIRLFPDLDNLLARNANDRDLPDVDLTASRGYPFEGPVWVARSVIRRITRSSTVSVSCTSCLKDGISPASCSISPLFAPIERTGADRASLTIVTNWFDELKARVKAK